MNGRSASDGRPSIERLVVAGVFAAIAAAPVGHALAVLLQIFAGVPPTPSRAFSAACVAMVAAAFAGRRIADKASSSLAGRWSILAAGVVATAVMLGAAGTWSAIPALAALGVGAAVVSTPLAQRLPRELDGARRQPLVAAAWMILGLFAVFQAARLSVFMGDASARDDSIRPRSAVLTEHSCFSALINTALLAGRGRTDIYDSDLFPIEPPIGKPAASALALDIGPFRLDRYNYPPPFLLLPHALSMVTERFLPLRTLWFAIEATIFEIVLLAVASWIGGRAGTVALLLAPLLWVSDPVLLTLQFGHSHILIVTLAVAAMLAFERRRPALGGALLAFVAIGKIFPASLVLYLAIRRQWKAVAWTALSGAVYVGLALLSFAPDLFGAFLFEQVPRYASGEGGVALATSDQRLAVNLSVASFALKLERLGVPGMPTAVGVFTLWLYLAILLAAVVLAGRRRTLSRAGRVSVWLGILNLGALRAPFAPMTYVAISFLWQAIVVAAAMESRKLAAALVGAAWILLSWASIPTQDGGASIALSLAAQTFALLLALWGTLAPPGDAPAARD